MLFSSCRADIKSVISRIVPTQKCKKRKKSPISISDQYPVRQRDMLSSILTPRAAHVKPERVRPGGRLHNIGIIEAAVETGLVAIASLMVPVLDVRIIQGRNNHTLAVGRVDAGLGTGEAVC